MYAASLDLPNMVRLLIRRGAKLNWEDGLYSLDEENSVFRIAAAFRSRRVLAVLFQEGCAAFGEIFHDFVFRQTNERIAGQDGGNA